MLRIIKIAFLGKIVNHRPTLEATAPKVKPESFFVESAAAAAAAPKENPLEASLLLSGAAPNAKPEGLLLSPVVAVVVEPNLNPPPSELQ